ncbi:MAG: radical SAM protein [Deltaproteobacteria bacterium]|nr:radical SAM protein [Deltaproteobacteria bacterium]
MNKRLKIMLITPPYHSGVVESAGVWMNLGFVTLAGALRERGHEVVLHDAMARFDDHETIQAEIERQRPDLVGLTGITASYLACVEVCRRAKEARPGLITVLGNTHASFMWEEVLNLHAEIDYVVRGEGEVTIAELADCLAAGDHPRKVQGIAYRDGGHPVTTGTRRLSSDLDALPAAWDLVDWPTYTYRPKAGSTLAVVSSSRGCAQACTFCSQRLFWELSWRPRRAEAFVAELEMLRDRFGVNIAMLADETPTVDPERWARILDLLIEREVGVELLLETRVDDILRDEALLPRYKEAGISHIYVGVEAARQDTLDLYQKDTSVEQGRRAIELINQADIVSETSFVLGTPDETPESIRTTVELAKHFGPDMAFFLAITPWPYTQLWPELEPHLEVRDYARFNLVEPVVKPEAMTLEEMHRALKSAAHEFFADKFVRLGELSAFKREFLVKVAAILMNHSYLAGDMARLRGEMPDWVRKMLEGLERENAHLAAPGHGGLPDGRGS